MFCLRILLPVVAKGYIFCDELLRTIDVEQLSSAVLVAILINHHPIQTDDVSSGEFFLSDAGASHGQNGGEGGEDPAGVGMKRTRKMMREASQKQTQIHRRLLSRPRGITVEDLQEVEQWITKK